jgi:hypothetical protein
VVNLLLDTLELALATLVGTTKVETKMAKQVRQWHKNTDDFATNFANVNDPLQLYLKVT